MKKAVLFIIVVASLCLFSCSSPENDGTNMANKINECNASYLEDVQKAESSFISDFNRRGFQTRTEAKQAFSNILKDAYSVYQNDLAKIYEQEAEMVKKYSGDYKKKAKYDGAFVSGVDHELEKQVRLLSVVTEIPEPVMAKIRTVIPPKPDCLQIQKDLVGHSLSEGVEDGYYSSSWRWTIKDGEISGFNIESVLSDTPQEYLLVADMRLTSEMGKSFDAKVKIRYILPQNDDWTIEFVQSKGMYIVKTGKYNDCINSFLDQGWATSTFWVENNCEIALEVGGKLLAFGEWKKFSLVVDPHDREGRMWVNDGRIDYVEIP